MNYQFFQFWGWRQRMSYGTSTGSYLKWQVPVQSCMQAYCLGFGGGLYVFLCYHYLLLWLCLKLCSTVVPCKQRLQQNVLPNVRGQVPILRQKERLDLQQLWNWNNLSKVQTCDWEWSAVLGRNDKK